MNEAMQAYGYPSVSNDGPNLEAILGSSVDVRYPRGSMSQRNAKLLRAYRRFCGDRLREYLDVPTHLTASNSPTRRVRNPILEDMEEIFRSGTADEKCRFRRSILKEMGR